MNGNEIKRRFPRASRSFIEANASCGREVAKLECGLGDEPLAEKKDEGSNRKGFHVRVTSFRHRLLDEDNLCEKYHVDLCRYAGVLPSDAPGFCKIEVAQIKIGRGELESTVVSVYEKE